MKRKMLKNLCIIAGVGSFLLLNIKGEASTVIATKHQSQHEVSKTFPLDLTGIGESSSLENTDTSSEGKQQEQLESLEEKVDSIYKVLSEYTQPDIERIREQVEEINASLQTTRPKVAIVRCGNVFNPNAVWIPELQDICEEGDPNMLKNLIQLNGEFTSVYMGQYNTGPYAEQYPSDNKSKATQVLGKDILLSKEWYFKNGEQEYGYTLAEKVTKGTALMDLYKAMGKECIGHKVVYSPDYSINLSNYPASNELPQLVTKLDVSQANAVVFSTRTDPRLYYARAQREMNFSITGMEKVLSAGEFIVMAERIMDFYGEEVMSDAEMNQLLQVYGGEIPNGLSPQEQHAYLYLKARGVLNVDLDYTADMPFEAMLDILMRIKDKGSRTDYKKIQLTVDLDSELVNRGFFTKNVNIDLRENALKIQSAEYDYSKARAYDYFIKVDSYTEFHSSSGDATENIFVPVVPCDTESGVYQDAEYLGREIHNDKVWYHFRIPIMGNKDKHLEETKKGTGVEKLIQINSSQDDDTPMYFYVEQGGGYYTYDGNTVGLDGKVILKRTEGTKFTDNDNPDYVDKERTESQKEIKSTQALKYMSMGVVYGATVKDSVVEYENLSMGTNGVSSVYNFTNCTYIQKLSNFKGKVKIYDATNSQQELDVETCNANKSFPNNLRVELPSGVTIEKFLSKVKIKTEGKNASGVQDVNAITNIRGKQVLVDIKSLFDAGLIYLSGSMNSEYPIPVNGVLTFSTKYGTVTLNNNTKEVIVGNTIYQADPEDLLFQSLKTTRVDEVTQKQITEWSVKVDYRAVIGWSVNDADIVSTGSGSTYSLSVTQKTTASKIIRRVNIKAPLAFTTNKVVEDGYVYNTTGDTKQLILCMPYALSNWVLVRGIDKETGGEKARIYVYYIKEAFKNKNHEDDSQWPEKDGKKIEIKQPNDIKNMANTLGYSVTEGSWCVREFNLSLVTNTKPGTFSYKGDVGFVYNIPTLDKNSMYKYLKGDYELPIFYDASSGNYVNINVNFFENYPYGYRPAKKVAYRYNSSTSKPITIKQKAEGWSERSIVAAPAGITNLLANSDILHSTLDGEFKRNATQMQNSSSGSNPNKYYYGTSVCQASKNASGEYMIHLEYEPFSSSNGSSIKGYKVKWKVQSDLQLYRVYSKKKVDLSNNKATYSYRWGIFDSVLTRDIDVESERANDLEISVEDGGKKNIFENFEDFSFKDFVHGLDTFFYILVIVAFAIIPRIGCTIVVVLVAISCLSDFKLVKVIAHKTVDLVRVFTFGARNIDNFKLKDSFFSLFCVFFTFTLILEGNFIRVMKVMIQFVVLLVRLIRQSL